MFKTIWEQKQQLDNFRKLKKSINWVIVLWKWKFCSIYMDCFFDITDVVISQSISDLDVSDFDVFEEDLKNTFNKAKQKATEILQTKSKEIFK